MTEGFDLVTGATGFSATHLIRELRARGRRVLATDRGTSLADAGRRRVQRQVGLPLDDPGVTWLDADLLAPESLRELARFPVRRVFHTASLYDYSAPLDLLRRVNVEGTRNLLEALPEVDRFVHWSTCGVFGKPLPASAGKKKNNLPFDERSSSPRNTPDEAAGPAGTRLVNPYSISKWEQEKLVWRWHRERGLPVTVIRPAPIYGPGSDYGHGGIVLAVARGWLPAMPADARNYITTSVHVEDLARFAAWVAERSDTIGEDYDVVDDSIVSYADFLHYIALLTGRRIREIPIVRNAWIKPAFIGAARAWTWAERRLGVPRPRVFEVQSATYIASSYWLSNEKARATGFSWRWPDVRAGLRQTVAWMRQVGWL